jgi:hypothetical protein
VISAPEKVTVAVAGKWPQITEDGAIRSASFAQKKTRGTRDFLNADHHTHSRFHGNVDVL